MDTNRLLNTVGFAGKLLIQSGAEIYRVEETMVRLCKSFVEVQDADSFVTPTGIMFSITVNDQTFTKIMRVHSRSVDLNCIDKINALSRKASVTPYTLEELETELDEIRKQTRYSFLVTMLFGAIGAAGFAIFFDGTWKEAICAFIIGIFIKCVCWCLEKIQLNSFCECCFCRCCGIYCCFSSFMFSRYRYGYYDHFQYYVACAWSCDYKCST